MTFDQFALYFAAHPWIVFLLIAWELPWKITALWRAAQRNDKAWFIAILILNTFAILDILYIFIWNKRPPRSII